ncbi:MAG: hypothetical protein WCI88_07670 [Chloroflexota bacterium]
MKKPLLSFSVSQEELLVLMTQLGLVYPFGVDPHSYQALAEDELALAGEVAAHALLARGYLIPASENNLRVEAALADVLTACAQPHKTLVIEAQHEGRPLETYHFHTLPNTFVLHTVAISAIHSFMVFESLAELQEMALRCMDLGTYTAAQYPPLLLADAVLTHARQVAQKEGAAAACAILGEGGLEPLVAGELARLLAGLKLNISVYCLQNRQDQTAQLDGFVLLGAENQLWRLTAKGDKSQPIKEVEALPVSPQTVLASMRSFLG